MITISVQISKNGIIYAPGTTINENILLNSDFHQLYNQTTGWDTSKNGTLLASNWGGYNSGVTNASTAYHAHIVLFRGEYVYQYTRETETWLGISQGGLQNRGLVANKTYTFSCDQYNVSGGANYLTGGPYYRQTGATAYGFHLGQFSFSGQPKDQWNHCVWTFTTPSNFDSAYNVSFYIYGMSGGAGTLYMKNPKLELGSKVTPVCLNSSEGYVQGISGIVESTSVPPTRLYEQFIESREFIEI